MMASNHGSSARICHRVMTPSSFLVYSTSSPSNPYTRITPLQNSLLNLTTTDGFLRAASTFVGWSFIVPLYDLRNIAVEFFQSGRANQMSYDSLEKSCNAH